MMLIILEWSLSWPESRNIIFDLVDVILRHPLVLSLPLFLSRQNCNCFHHLSSPFFSSWNISHLHLFHYICKHIGCPLIIFIFIIISAQLNQYHLYLTSDNHPLSYLLTSRIFIFAIVYVFVFALHSSIGFFWSLSLSHLSDVSSDKVPHDCLVLEVPFACLCHFSLQKYFPQK